MTKIAKLDRAGTEALSALLKKKLKEIEAETGLSLRLAGGKYDGLTATLKIVAATVGDDGMAENQHASSLEYMLRHTKFGMLTKETAKCEFTVLLNGRYQVVKAIGWNSRCYKNPLIIRARDGKQYKVSDKFFDNAKVAA